MKASISIDNLSKAYLKKGPPAVDSLSLSVAPGEVYGFLGANGAGKSTTIRLLLGFIKPTSGGATVMGKDVVTDSVASRHHIGYLAGDVALWPKVTGNELFAYLSQLQGKTDTAYLKQLISRFQAEPNKRIDALSKGNRQKIGVIQALMHKPSVLILDEPTSGLDPLMQEVFYQCIAEAKDRGAAVFVSSHNLAEAQRMCDRIGIIKHGKLIKEQSIHDDTNLGAPLLRVVFKKSGDVDAVSRNTGMKVISKQGTTAVLQPTVSISNALAILSKYEIVGLTTEQLNLEDEFLEFYGDGA